MAGTRQRLVAQRNDGPAEWRARLQRLGSFGPGTGSAFNPLEQRTRFEAARTELGELAGAGPMELESDVAAKREELAKSVEGFSSFLEGTRHGFLDARLDHVTGRSEQLDRAAEGRPSILNDRRLAEVEAFFQL